MSVDEDVSLFGVPFLKPLSDLWVLFIASCRFLGAILSPLRNYGYILEEIKRSDNISI